MREDETALRRDAEEEPGGDGAGPAAQDGGRRVVWRAGPAGFLTEPQAVPLPPAWRLFLLGEGAATSSLSLLAGARICGDVVEMRAAPAHDVDGPEDLHRIAAPRLRPAVGGGAGARARLG